MDEHNGDLTTQFTRLNENVKFMRDSIERMEAQIGKIGALEVHSSTHSEAFSRAFNEIKEIQTKASVHQEADDKKHAVYDRAIWLSTGFVMAVCLFWTLIGYRLVNTIDETTRSVAEVRTFVEMTKYKDSLRQQTPREVPNGG